jgi:hypothetical protein
MKNLLVVSLVLAGAFGLLPPMQERGLGVTRVAAERRIALVIGNSAYETAPLKNPANDAQDMTRALRELGFDVTAEANLRRDEMKRSVQAFGAKLRGGGVGLFYYAGHGLQVRGVNYLVPVDAKINSEAEVDYECVDAGLVLAQMEEASTRVNIVILDACRNNPYARSFRSAARGLAPMTARGTLIAYATKPGSVAGDGSARNGIYTQELLKFMRTPGLRVQDVFIKVRESILGLTRTQPEPQEPWESTSLVGDFYFIEPRAPAPAAPTANVNPEELLELIKSHQQSEVKESYGEARGQNFSEEDLREFKTKNVPQAVADKLRHDSYFIDVVLAVKRMEPGARYKLLSAGMQTYKKTWAQLGGISREGQTDAGHEAERLLAKAIVDLVKELYTLPEEKLNGLRK